MDKRFLSVRLKEAKSFSGSGGESFGGTARKLRGDFRHDVIVMYQIVWVKVRRFFLLTFKTFRIKNNDDTAV